MTKREPAGTAGRNRGLRLLGYLFSTLACAGMLASCGGGGGVAPRIPCHGFNRPPPARSWIPKTERSSPVIWRKPIRQVLKAITEERGSLDLSFLKDMSVEDARNWLTKFNGVGPKTAAIVLCFSLDMPAFPVDTHVYRVTGRIGLHPEKMSVEQAHPHLESLFPPETYYTAHLNIIRLGREICTARKANCKICPLKKLCDYGSKSDG